MGYQSVVSGTFPLENNLHCQSNHCILPEQVTWITGLCKQLAWPLKHSLTENFRMSQLDWDILLLNEDSQ